jgi:CHAD domain-containing protein
LRIADGLDHGHLQDAAIIRVTKTGRTICVRISSGCGRANLEAAQRKSDQWHAVFPCDIRLKAVAGRALRARLPRSSEMPPGEAARRLLWTHYGALRANVAAVAEAGNSAALHDLRVAIRRMRSVLRVFRDALAPTGGARIDRDLQKLNAALGEARDLDVWIDYLVRNALKARLRGHPRWANFVGHQRELRRLQQITVRRHLRGASFKALEHRIGHLLRVELPRATAAAAPPDAEAGWERRLLAKFLRRALKLRGQRHSHSPAELHQLRMALRRVRHIGEFFGSRLAAPAGELMKRVQAVERMLGRMRDVDLAIARIQLEGPAPPRLLVGKLERRRLHNRIDLRRAWRRLEKRRFRRLMRRPPAS